MNKTQIQQTLKTAKELGLDTENLTVEQLAVAIKLKTGNASAEDLANVEVPKDFKMPVGRPVETGSARQERLAKIAAKVAAGEVVKRGRPVEMDSKRQEELTAKKARQAEIIAAGGSIHRGRPTDPTSPRQIELAKKEAKRKEYFLLQGAGVDVTASLAAGAVINGAAEGEEVDSDIENEVVK